VSHPELKAEQAYVDHAYACLERMRDVVLRAADAADGEVAQAALDAWAAKRLATFEDAERGLLFGRLDFEAVERALYIGRRWVHDDEGDQIVVNWQAPAARPFYTATPQDPQRVTLRRRFRAQGRKLLDIADEALDGSTLDGASVGDFLLEVALILLEALEPVFAARKAAPSPAVATVVVSVSVHVHLPSS